MKKGQMVGQIFVYILAIVVAGGILLFGYDAIRTFGQQAEDVGFVEFKTTIERDFKDMASDFGSVKIKNYEPGKIYEEACFIDKDILDFEGKLQEQFTQLFISTEKNRPIILDTLKTGTNYDLFLVPGEKQLDLGLIDVSVKGEAIAAVQRDDALLCVPIKGGKFSVRIEGTGKSTIVSAYNR